MSELTTHEIGLSGWKSSFISFSYLNIFRSTLTYWALYNGYRYADFLYNIYIFWQCVLKRIHCQQEWPLCAYIIWITNNKQNETPSTPTIQMLLTLTCSTCRYFLTRSINGFTQESSLVLPHVLITKRSFATNMLLSLEKDNTMQSAKDNTTQMCNANQEVKWISVKKLSILMSC